MNATESTLSRRTISFGWGLVVASLVNAALVVAKEKSANVQSTMKHLTGHHWVTHVAVVLLVFTGCGLGWPDTQTPSRRLINSIVCGMAAAILIIIGFYLLAD